MCGGYYTWILWTIIEIAAAVLAMMHGMDVLHTNALRSRDVLHSRYTSGKSMVPLHLTCNGYGCSVSV